jgi:hypothetical protein
MAYASASRAHNTLSEEMTQIWECSKKYFTPNIQTIIVDKHDLILSSLTSIPDFFHDKTMVSPQMQQILDNEKTVWENHVLNFMHMYKFLLVRSEMMQRRPFVTYIKTEDKDELVPMLQDVNMVVSYKDYQQYKKCENMYKQNEDDMHHLNFMIKFANLFQREIKYMNDVFPFRCRAYDLMSDVDDSHLEIIKPKSTECVTYLPISNRNGWTQN